MVFHEAQHPSDWSRLRGVTLLSSSLHGLDMAPLWGKLASHLDGRPFFYVLSLPLRNKVKIGVSSGGHGIDRLVHYGRHWSDHGRAFRVHLIKGFHRVHQKETLYPKLHERYEKLVKHILNDELPQNALTKHMPGYKLHSVTNEWFRVSDLPFILSTLQELDRMLADEVDDKPLEVWRSRRTKAKPEKYS